jgi:hypothetical protein
MEYFDAEDFAFSRISNRDISLSSHKQDMQLNIPNPTASHLCSVSPFSAGIQILRQARGANVSTKESKIPTMKKNLINFFMGRSLPQTFVVYRLPLFFPGEETTEARPLMFAQHHLMLVAVCLFF